LSQLFEPLTLAHGPTLKNRLVLAPLTNSQSHADGTLSDEEFTWLTLRANGGSASARGSRASSACSATSTCRG